MYKLVNRIKKLTISYVVYELNTKTASDAQGDLTSNSETIVHNINRIWYQKLLSFWTIGEVFVLPLTTKPIIRLAPQTLITPMAKEISADATLDNSWTNRTLWRISRNGIDRSIPISIPIYRRMRKSSTPDSSFSTRTRGTRTSITIGNTSPPCDFNVSLKIDESNA